MRFQLLGPLGAETDEGPIELGPHKQRSVLAVLLLHANEIVATDRIIDLVWGEAAPRTADHSVQIYVSDLRKALANGSPADLIETRPPGYVLNVPPDSVDALRFQQLVKDGLTAVRTGDVASGRPKLEKALGLWTAAPLADFAYEEFAQGFIRSLEELRSDALEALAAIELDQGRHEEARAKARLAIDADPLREESRRLMMLALYRSGRQAQALRHFGEYRALLTEELGIEPSAELRDLEERILLQDPSLAALPLATAEGNPYQGLRPFSEEDADVYFGREALVEEVLDRLRSSSGFVSIVGPSGSGKSSAAQAGVVPRLREVGDTVVVFQPGARPLWELAGAIDRAGFGSRAGLLRRFESGGDVIKSVVDRPLVLVVDQFEELFTLADPDVALRFSELIARGITDPDTPLRVVATLRADYYDRPLSIPALAGVFSDSVVSVKPMTPLEVESAVVRPADAAGVSVEPALLAQIMADMGDEPGALPLLQVTLFELFEKCEGRLTLADYEDLGGLHGALTTGADELLDEFDEDGRDLVEQVMMRMVQKGRTMSTSRPVPLRDLLDLGIDSVVLQGVLEAFGSKRLITFDRDASGAAVVEIAHEYLISEWPQLAGWIERHSDDLERLYALHAATDEWLAAGRSEDYLLRGGRLDGFESWRASSTLRLTSVENEFLDASASMRAREESNRREQEAKEKALARRAKRRLAYFGATVTLLAAAIATVVILLVPEAPPDAVLWFDGRGDASFGDLIAGGLDVAKDELGYEVFEATGISQAHLIDERLKRGTGLVLVDVTKASSFEYAELQRNHPDVYFAGVDCSPGIRETGILAPNERCTLSENTEVGFLAGVAAAAASKTGRVGFIGGVAGGDDIPVIHEMHDGFVAGVHWVSEETEIEAIYLSGWTGGYFSVDGWISPRLAQMAANLIYRRDADVIFHAAGAAGVGLFAEAASYSRESGTHVWAIGVDIDQYMAMGVSDLAFADDETVSLWRDHLLTSVLKRVDLGVAEAMRNYRRFGDPGWPVLNIENGGIDYATTGGHVDHLVPVLEEAKRAMVDGSAVITLDPERPVILLIDELLDR